MATCLTRTALFFALMFISTINFYALEPQKAVSPNALPETQALLEMIYAISGKYTLSGQHNYPATMDKNSRFAEKYMGKKPVIWSTDMGFAEEGDTDSYLARPDIVKEAIRQHKMGSIITICWHAVPPTADEPITFRPLPGADPNNLISVQGQLTDEQFESVLTPGTPLNKKWLAQMDTVAYYLKQLQEAKVPVLWRPYHEMNGSWFWWGGRTEGEITTKALYRGMFERFTQYHGLTNLVWMWNVDRVSREGMEFEKYYPGNETLDILSLDVYGSDFAQSYYDGLMNLSQGKPLLFGEVGNPPSVEVLDAQPNWTSWVIWAGMVRNTTKAQYQTMIDDPRILFQEDAAYLHYLNQFREKCKLGLIDPASNPMSGNWILNEQKSMSIRGFANSAYKMNIVQLGNELMIEQSFIVEWGDDRVAHETIMVNGEELSTATPWGAEQLKSHRWENGNLVINTTVNFTRDGQTSEMKSGEIWTINDDRTELTIQSKAQTPRGEQVSELFYERLK